MAPTPTTQQAPAGHLPGRWHAAQDPSRQDASPFLPPPLQPPPLPRHLWNAGGFVSLDVRHGVAIGRIQLDALGAQTLQIPVWREGEGGGVPWGVGPRQEGGDSGAASLSPPAATEGHQS